MRLVDESRADAAWWEDEGRRIGAELGSVHAAVVVAPTPDDAAAIALGIGAVQGETRRVVVADLADDTRALQRHVVGDDPHGVADCFLFGVSINRIAHPVAGAKNLFVLPSGTQSVLDEEIYRNDRWRRLVAGFREVGALLLLVAPAGAPLLADLVGYTDGVIAGGETALPAGARTLAVAEPPSGLPVAGADVPSDVASPAATEGDPAAAVETSAQRSATRWVVGGAALLAVAALATAIAVRLPERRVAAAPAPAPDTVAAPVASIDSAAASVAPETPLVLNPADSSQATAYSVELAKFSTPLGALMRVRDELPGSVPATTFGVVPLGADGTLWYRVLAGVAATRRGADSTLAALRRIPGVADSAAGVVVATPLAFRLEEHVDPGAAPGVVNDYRTRGIPAYALRQADGTVTLYAGAFATPEQAALFTTYLRAAGIEPALTYRLGRTL
ncbi:MAG TPA: hypothetical protein VF761_19455 [Gemmatimonadaceae bacterium]